jgi:membrane-bound ClpP family serine protease
MFSFSVLKTIQKFAWLLLIPMVALGIDADFPIHNSPDASVMTNMVAGLVFSCIVALLAMMLVDNALFFIDRYLPDDAIFGLVGIVLLTFCLYGVSFFYHQLPPSPFKPVWHLAAGCYAFALFERNAFFAALRANAAEHGK